RKRFMFSGYKASSIARFSSPNSFSLSTLIAACSNATLAPYLQFWSGRRESNPRPTAWKAVTLPLSYSRSNCPAFSISEVLRCAQDLGGGLKRPPIASTWKAVTLPLSYSRPHCHFTLARSFAPAQDFGCGLPASLRSASRPLNASSYSRENQLPAISR